MLLGQAIYPCLHVLEVSLRNAMHRALQLKYGRSDWWEAAESLTAVDRSEIEKAKASLRVKRHAATPDKIISDLSFGFWVSLLNTRHEQASYALPSPGARRKGAREMKFQRY